MQIDLNQLSKTYKNQTILDDISFRLESGKIYGLLGINGAGKSTLMKILYGLEEPSSGTIRYDGQAKVGKRLVP